MAKFASAFRSEGNMTGTDMVNWLKHNDTAVGRALVVLRDLQLDDEQAVKQSLHVNFRGFKKGDAKRGTADAAYFEKFGKLTPEMLAYWRTPTKQGQRLSVYWRQLLAAAYRKQRIEDIKRDAANYRTVQGRRAYAA